MLSDYRQQRYFRKLERLLTRVLELDEILHKDAVFDKERAAKIRDQIRRSQKKLDAIYEELDLKDDDA
mgnify:CR=1 FL=1